MDGDARERFATAMMNLVHRIRKEVGYTPRHYIQMLHSYGGLETAQLLLKYHDEACSLTLTELWTRNRLDLTVEALVLASAWRELFTAQELAVAKKRLEEHGYHPETQ
jgi:pimeloyl-ACP methyl ester carboxylesterase